MAIRHRRGQRPHCSKRRSPATEAAQRRSVQRPATSFPSSTPQRLDLFVPFYLGSVSLSYCTVLMGKSLPQETLGECHQLILESTGTGVIGHKRKQSSSAFCRCSSPPSPSGVIGSCFSCGSSCDSWATWPSSAPSSPEVPPPFKRLHGSSIDESFGEEGVSDEGVGPVSVLSITSRGYA